jgi:hypothetical protein
MMQVIATKNGTRDAIRDFQQRLETDSGGAQQRKWGFPDGTSAEFPTYTLQSSLGDMEIGLPGRWSDRVPHLVRFRKESGSLSPDVELNIPNDLDRRVSGVYMRTSESTFLCTRGSFTAWRGRVPRKDAFAFFKNWLVEVQDGDRTVKIIPVTALDSSTLADDIAKFADAVGALKNQYKAFLKAARPDGQFNPLPAAAGTAAKSLQQSH